MVLSLPYLSFGTYEVWCDRFLEASCPLKSLESENGFREKKTQLTAVENNYDLPRSNWKSPTEHGGYKVKGVIDLLLTL